MRKLYLAMGLALVAMLVAAGAAFAAYTFDPATGTGFVGKGDVQLIYGYNNQQLQTNASKIDFRAITTSETSWTCSRPAPTPQDPNREITQQRNNTTTAQGLATTVARDNSKGKNGPVTGFNLIGYDSPPTVISSDGPAEWLHVRRRQPGDDYRTYGAPGHQRRRHDLVHPTPAHNDDRLAGEARERES